MNTKKYPKLIKLAAAGLFLVALAINVKVTLDDPFVMLSQNVIAQTTGEESSGGFCYPCPCNQIQVTRTVNNYTLTYKDSNWLGVIFNKYTYMDRLDCIEKKCYTASKDGTCSFTSCESSN